MRLHISRGIYDALLADARLGANTKSMAVERCGLLFGTSITIDAFEPVENIHPEPCRHFELDPVALIAAVRAMRWGGRRMIGHYHSHPTGGSPEPSPADAASADHDGRLWLIITPTDAGLWRAVHARAHRSSFERVELAID